LGHQGCSRKGWGRLAAGRLAWFETTLSRLLTMVRSAAAPRVSNHADPREAERSREFVIGAPRS